MGNSYLISSNHNDWNWIGDFAAKRALLTPNKVAIVDNIEKKKYTFKDINSRANKLARVLHELGVSKGDRIAMFSKNNLDCIDLFFSTGKIGAILVPLNIRLAIKELEYLIDKTKPKILFYDPLLLKQVKEIKKVVEGIKFVAMGKNPVDDDPASRILMDGQDDSNVERPAIDFEDPHLILFTGGTTGLPKGAVLSHRMILWNCINTIITWNLDPNEVQPLLFPLFHTGGWNVLLVPCFYQGATTVLMGDFDADETLRIIDDEKCTIVVGVPTMFHMMSMSPNFQEANFDSVKIFISGGAACPEEGMKRYWAKGKLMKMGYGLTEAGPNNFYLPEDRIKEKPLSVGYPVFHNDLKVINKDGKEVKQGEVGELLIKGPHVFSGYWDEPEETKKTIEPDGYIHTGDLVRQDDESFYYIVGRSKEMYISGGENIYPVEIEEILYKHPAIALAAVIGVPDEKWGEVGKAFITLKPGKSITKDELRDYLSRNLAKYKVPKYFEIVSELPLSAAGKILKRKLK
ncbi:MAG: acyl-CoA synthetase [Candidatus Hodarchaeales archaeon]